MNTRKFSTILLIALIIFSAVSVFAEVPELPHTFFGDVTIGGSMAPDGTLIEARIEGVTYDTTTTTSGEYALSVIPDNPDTGAVEGGVNGDIVEFYVDDAWAADHTFMIGEITELSLEPTISFEIFLYEGWNLIGLPMIPEDPSIEVVLSDIIYYVNIVYAFDGETDTWSSYLPAVPYLGTLTEMVGGRGYWISVITDVIWTIDIPGYYEPEPTEGVNYTWSGAISRNTAPFYVSSDIVKITWSVELEPDEYYYSFSISLYDVSSGWIIDSWHSLEEVPEGDTYAYISPGYYYLSFNTYGCSYIVTLETFNP